MTPLVIRFFIVWGFALALQAGANVLFSAVVAYSVRELQKLFEGAVIVDSDTRGQVIARAQTQEGDTRMSLGTFFKKFGVDLEKVIDVGAKAAEVAEPVVDVLFPALAAVYNGAVNEAVKLLAAGQAAAAQGGSTTVQLENVAAAVAPELIAYAQQEGLPAPTAAHITAFTQAILTSLQVLVSIETGTPPPTVTSSATTTAAAPAASAPTPAPVLAAA